jgi:hypothetical protein
MENRRQKRTLRRPNDLHAAKRIRLNTRKAPSLRFSEGGPSVRLYEVNSGSALKPVVQEPRRGRTYKNVPARSAENQARTLLVSRIVGNLSKQYDSPEDMKRTAKGLPDDLRPLVVRYIDRSYTGYHINLLRQEMAERAAAATHMNVEKW